MALATQLDIPLEGAEAHDALHYWADSLAESRGEVFTKTEVVEFIFDTLVRSVYGLDRADWECLCSD
jgi:hypothetical protein